jgi:hypothetical protein
MAHNSQCDSYPDIWQQPPPKGDPDHERIVALNKLHGRVYGAARNILQSDFCGSAKIPEDPSEFPGNPGVLDKDQIVQMATVHGILVADDWEPTQGKLNPADDDRVATINGERIVIDRRFVDAVVKAVQEYASGKDLFVAGLEFLAEQGKQRTPTSSSGGLAPHQPQSPAAQH